MPEYRVHAAGMPGEASAARTDHTGELASDIVSSLLTNGKSAVIQIGKAFAAAFRAVPPRSTGRAGHAPRDRHFNPTYVHAFGRQLPLNITARPRLGLKSNELQRIGPGIAAGRRPSKAPYSLLQVARAVATIAGMTLPPAQAMAQSPQPVTITRQSAVQATQRLSLPLNQSQVLRVSEPVSRIAVGNANIVDAVALTDRSFYVLGKAVGTTNLAVFGGSSQLLAVVDVSVGTDVEGVKAALHALMPSDNINVRSVNDSIALSGILGSPAKVNQAVDIAKKFADKDHVVNDLRVKGSQQVMLQVRIAEVQRSVSKSFGFKPFLSSPGFSLATLDPIDLGNFALAIGRVVSGNFAFTMVIDALEAKGAVKTLAEPNLVAMSGDTASFLAGGEFPVPVAQSTNAGVPTVTVEFKPFGVSLAFTPTVLDGDLINLVVAPEVSQLDKANSVTFGGFTIPGIKTRRARTTVELRDGQSFAIAGLLSSDFNDTMRGIPGVMDVPVLGALFRSSSYLRNETELVIIVTPKLVQPAAAQTLIAPTDSFVPPSDAQFFVMGRTENPDSGLAPRTGGLAGRYGHIIR